MQSLPSPLMRYVDTIRFFTGTDLAPLAPVRKHEKATRCLSGKSETLFVNLCDLALS